MASPFFIHWNLAFLLFGATLFFNQTLASEASRRQSYDEIKTAIEAKLAKGDASRILNNPRLRTQYFSLIDYAARLNRNDPNFIAAYQADKQRIQSELNGIHAIDKAFIESPAHKSVRSQVDAAKFHYISMDTPANHRSESGRNRLSEAGNNYLQTLASYNKFLRSHGLQEANYHSLWDPVKSDFKIAHDISPGLGGYREGIDAQYEYVTGVRDTAAGLGVGAIAVSLPPVGMALTASGFTALAVNNAADEFKNMESTQEQIDFLKTKQTEATETLEILQHRLTDVRASGNVLEAYEFEQVITEVEKFQKGLDDSITAHKDLKDSQSYSAWFSTAEAALGVAGAGYVNRLRSKPSSAGSPAPNSSAVNSQVDDILSRDMSPSVDPSPPLTRREVASQRRAEIADASAKAGDVYGIPADTLEVVGATENTLILRQNGPSPNFGEIFEVPKTTELVSRISDPKNLANNPLFYSLGKTDILPYSTGQTPVLGKWGEVPGAGRTQATVVGYVPETGMLKVVTEPKTVNNPGGSNHGHFADSKASSLPLADFYNLNPGFPKAPLK
jgi:hypothetical protein